MQAIQISTHTSRVGCDGEELDRLEQTYKFLLTHPVWDVTKMAERSGFFNAFLLTHPVWDVTVSTVAEQGKRIAISTHTSRVGCDYFRLWQAENG